MLSYSRIKKAILWLSITGLIYTVGCATIKIKEGVFSSPHNKYTIRTPGKEWKSIKVGKEDIAFWYKQYKAMITIISSDIESKGFSLETLNRHLFLGLTHKKIISKDAVTVDNQSALHIILEGEMDNDKLTIDSYIIKAGDKVYDLVCWAPSGSFNYVAGDFENMVGSFRFSN